MFGICPKTKKNTANQTVYGAIFCGGDKRDRTADLLNAIQALSQLSYTPIFCCAVRQLLYYSTADGFVKRFVLFFGKIFGGARFRGLVELAVAEAPSPDFADPADDHKTLGVNLPSQIFNSGQLVV